MLINAAFLNGSHSRYMDQMTHCHNSSISQTLLGTNQRPTFIQTGQEEHIKAFLEFKGEKKVIVLSVKL